MKSLVVLMVVATLLLAAGVVMAEGPIDYCTQHPNYPECSGSSSSSSSVVLIDGIGPFSPDYCADHPNYPEC